MSASLYGVNMMASFTNQNLRGRGSFYFEAKFGPGCGRTLLRLSTCCKQRPLQKLCVVVITYTMPMAEAIVV